MTVTRDVIFDLLPAYFANEVSADTRALVEEYFATDPEFARMARRFQSLAVERTVEREGAADRERAAFDAAREAAELPQRTRAAALMWGFAALFSLGMALATWNARLGFRHPGIFLGVFFGLVAVLVFSLSFRIRPDSWWRGLAGLDDASLKHFRRRRKAGSQA